MVQENSYITVQAFMRNDLNLKGNELLVYALIYGFSQDGESEFKGSINYICEWIGASRPTVIKALQELTGSGLVKKRTETINSVTFCRYAADLELLKRSQKSLGVVKILDGGSQETLPGGSQETLLGGSQETLPNNTMTEKTKIDNDKGKLRIDYLAIINAYNDTCVSLPRVTKLSESRKSAIKARLKSGYTVDDLKRCFEMAERSNWLKGGNPRNWHADFDWLMRDANIAKVLDGKYEQNDGRPQNNPAPASGGNVFLGLAEVM